MKFEIELPDELPPPFENAELGFIDIEEIIRQVRENLSGKDCVGVVFIAQTFPKLTVGWIGIEDQDEFSYMLVNAFNVKELLPKRIK
jgi:hypothetical protein